MEGFRNGSAAAAAILAIAAPSARATLLTGQYGFRNGVGVPDCRLPDGYQRCS